MPTRSAFPRQCAVLGAGSGATSIWGEEVFLSPARANHREVSQDSRRLAKTKSPFAQPLVNQPLSLIGDFLIHLMSSHQQNIEDWLLQLMFYCFFDE